MSLEHAIRSNLPICGDCPACKLRIWANEMQTKDPTICKIEVDGIRYKVAVRCMWSKSQLQEPLELIFCSGKQYHQESDKGAPTP